MKLRETLAQAIPREYLGGIITTYGSSSETTTVPIIKLTPGHVTAIADAVLRALAAWEPSDAVWQESQMHMNDWCNYNLPAKEAVRRILRAMAEEGT